MPEQENNIPQPIENAHRALENLREESITVPAALTKRINAMAMRLEQSGQDTSPENLRWHIEQGEEHIKNIGRRLEHNKQKKNLSPLERYKEIIKNKNTPPPAPDLSHIKWSLEQAQNYIENDQYEAVDICKSLIAGKHYDIIEALHDNGDIQTDNAPSALLVAALELDDTWTLHFIHQKSDNIYANDGYNFYKAAKNGSLECIKYLLKHYNDDHKDQFSETDLCAYTAYENNHLHIYTYLNDNHPIREDMNRHITVQAIENNRPDFVLKSLEYQKADEQKIQLFMGAAAQNNNLDLYKTIKNHFNVPAFSTLNEKEEYPLQQFIPVVIGNGYIDMARHIMAEAPVLPPRIYNSAMDVASMTGNMDGLRYLVEELDVFDKLDGENITAFIYDTGPLQHWEAYEYLNELYAAHNPEIAPHPLPDEVTALIDQWQNTLHINPPPGLTEYTPIGLKTKTYNALKEILSDEINKHANDADNNENNENPNPWQQMIETQHGFTMAVYKLSRLFGTANRALDYMEKWGDFEKSQPLRHLANQIQIPLTKAFNAKAWGDAVIKYGPVMGELAAYPENLPNPPPWSKSREDMLKRILKRRDQNPGFAELCVALNVPEKAMNLSQDIWSELKRQGFPEKNLPDITIDGETFDKPGTKFYLMKNDDIRGFILGRYMNSCQYVSHKNGGMPTLHGMSSEHGGFYCIEDKNKDIIGTTWAWRGTNGELVFDSLEHRQGDMNKEKWEKLLTAFTAELERTPSDISDFLVAVENHEKLAPGTYKETALPATPKDYAENHYRDSYRQFHVWTASPEKIRVYENVQKKEDLEAMHTLMQRLFPDSIYAHENAEQIQPEDKTPKTERLHKMLLAYKNDIPVGFADIRHMASHEEQNGFYLEFIGIDSEKTNSIARHLVVAKLLEAVEFTVNNAARTDKTVHLLTHEDNWTVQKGMHALGFEYCGRQENYFNDGKAALAYAIDLTHHSIANTIKAKRSRAEALPAPDPANAIAIPAPVVQIWEPAL